MREKHRKGERDGDKNLPKYFNIVDSPVLFRLRIVENFKIPIQIILRISSRKILIYANIRIREKLYVAIRPEGVLYIFFPSIYPNMLHSSSQQGYAVFHEYDRI